METVEAMTIDFDIYRAAVSADNMMEKGDFSNPVDISFHFYYLLTRQWN